MLRLGIRTLIHPTVTRTSLRVSLTRNFHRSAISGSKLTDQKYDEAELMSSKLTSQEFYGRKNDFYGKPGQEDAASEAELTKYKKLEAMTGLINGIFGVITLFGGFLIYQKWPNIRSWWYKMEEDEFIPIIPKKKQVELPQISNKNDSSVPGLYIWGDNTNYIVSKDRKVAQQKYPIRLDWFDGKKLKAVYLGEKSALAIDSKGDLIQWGKGFNDSCDPQYTVKGQGLVMAKISNNAIYALTQKNEILIIPESVTAQNQKENGILRRKWHYLTKELKPFQKLSLSLLSKDEKITDLKTGKNHLVLLTNKGKAYTSSTGLTSISVSPPSRGQYGLPEFSQFATPPPINKLFEITLLNNEITKNKQGKVDHIEPRFIKQIATGHYHTLALDSNGEVYSFGQNTFGQLGHPVSYDSEIISFPKKITLFSKHVKRDFFPDVQEIHAGGETSFATIIPIQLYRLVRRGKHQADEATVTEDAFVVGFGNNLKGQIGNGHYVHAQYDPVKVKEFSRFEDYNETTKEMEKIKIVDWSTGFDHSFIKLQNKDVLLWGGNDSGQLGNGKRNRIPKPTIAPALIEPSFTKETYKDLTFTNRLQLNDNQKIVAGESTSAIYYTS